MDFEKDVDNFINDNIQKDIEEENPTQSSIIISAIIDNINDEVEAINNYSKMLKIDDLPENIINTIEEIKSDEEEHLVILRDLLDIQLSGDEYPDIVDESLEEEPKSIEYKGYTIDNGLTYPNMVSVFVDGDDWLFDTVEEAKAEIDNFVDNEA